MPSPNGRDRAGRFSVGNPGGPGNPGGGRAAAARLALCEAITTADLAKLARSLLEQALDGDTTAARVLLAYVIGPPMPPEATDAARPVITIAAEGAALLDLRDLPVAGR